jgi:hypothetical protein
MSHQQFADTYLNREHLFSMGTEEVSGTHYVSIPVSNGMVDYEERYGIDQASFDHFSVDVQAALEFVQKCRRREMDDRLIVKPGRLRGTPI